jgi:hypothetical protein
VKKIVASGALPDYFYFLIILFFLLLQVVVAVVGATSVAKLGIFLATVPRLAVVEGGQGMGRASRVGRKVTWPETAHRLEEEAGGEVARLVTSVERRVSCFYIIGGLKITHCVLGPFLWCFKKFYPKYVQENVKCNVMKSRALLRTFRKGESLKYG